MRKSVLSFSAIALLIAAAAPARAATVTLAPTEPGSKDVFAYQFFATSNFNNLLFGPTNFGTLLAVANTGGSSPHNIKALIDFDLSSTGVTKSAQVGSAILTLRVVDGGAVGFPVANPSASFPIDVALALAGGAWDESTVTWNTFPAAGSVVDTETISGINVDVSFDVTQAIRDWIDNPSSQFGFLLSQPTEVRNGSNTAVGAVFASSGFGSNVPSLAITVVPEPSSVMLGLLGAGAVGLAIARRRRSA